MSLTQKRGDVDVKVAGAILVALLLSTACAWRLTPVTATCLQQGTCILEANQEQANKTRDRQILEANQDQANQTGNMGPNTTQPVKRRPVPGMLIDDTVNEAKLPADIQDGPSTPESGAILLGPVDLILFDLDGTLTCTPGNQDKMGAGQKAEEIAPKLEWLVPALDTLARKGIKFGIMSRSSKVKETLNEVKKRYGIDLLKKGMFTENFIRRFSPSSSGLYTKGELIAKLLKDDPVWKKGCSLEKIMLIDDDWECESKGCAQERIKFYPVDSRGGEGLTEDMFMEVIEGFGDGVLYKGVQKAIETRRKFIRDIMAKHEGAD